MGKIENVMFMTILLLAGFIGIMYVAYPVACELIAQPVDFTNMPLVGNESFDCSIEFEDPEMTGGIRVGIYNLSSGGMSRCGTLKQRCQIQEGILEPKIGSMRLAKYSFDCNWIEEYQKCVCRYPS